MILFQVCAAPGDEDEENEDYDISLQVAVVDKWFKAKAF